LRTGMRPDGTVIMPFMPWLIYKNLGDDDLRAIYRYLQSLPATSNHVPPAEVGPGETGAAKGEAIYQGFCAACHGKEGGGTFLNRVPLRQVAPAMDPGVLEQTIKDGIAGTLMPSFAKTLSSQDLAVLLQFLRTWGGQ
ncbi:MAG: c-type cytochrome, partial [Chloroflexota bacterium]